MSSTMAKVVLAVSALLLGGVAVTALRNSSTSPRSDLRGANVRLPTITPEGSFPTFDRSVSSAVARTSGPSVSAPETSAAEPAAGPAAGPGRPTRIAIPSLNLDAVVVPVGIEDDGTMEIPGAIEAGWYRFGPRPGSTKGSAVIAGHVDHKKTPGVFIGLRSLEIGQEVVVTDDGGIDHRYVVRERFQVGKRELPVKTLFQREGDPVLTLITCGGKFDRKARSYDDNIVIRATPVVTPVVTPSER